mgnify:FL=1
MAEHEVPTDLPIWLVRFAPEGWLVLLGVALPWFHGYTALESSVG